MRSIITYRCMISRFSRSVKWLKELLVYSFINMQELDFSKYLFDLELPEVEDLSDNFLAKQPIDDIHDIFFTITPSNEYFERLEEAHGLILTEEALEHSFRAHLFTEMDNLTKYYAKKHGIKLDVHIHYEKESRVHAHGIILGMPSRYYPYEGELHKMSSRLHKVFGKPRLRSSICALFTWSHANKHTYMVKQNYMNPQRIIYG